jgi:hypothetical protein
VHVLVLVPHGRPGSGKGTAIVRSGAKYESPGSETTSIAFVNVVLTTHAPPLQMIGAPDWWYASHGWSGHEFVGA